MARVDDGSGDGDTIRTDSGGDLDMLASSAVASMPSLTVGGMHEQEDADSTDEEAQKKQARDVDSADEDDRKMPAVDTTGKYAEKKEEDNQKMAATENSKKRPGLSSKPPSKRQNKKARRNGPNKNNSFPEQETTKPHDVAKSAAGGLCCALELCRSFGTKKVYVSGNEAGKDANGTNCIGCKSLFHYCCLFQYEGNLFCMKCYKNTAVGGVLVKKSFQTLFNGIPVSHKCDLKTRKDLEAYVSEELQTLKLGPYRSKAKWKKDYDKQRQKIRREIEKAKTPAIKKEKEKLLKHHNATEHINKRNFFETVEHLIRHWKESTDGVVVGLRYDGDAKKGKFFAKTKYQEGNDIVTESFHVADDWVFANYGHEVASKLMSRAKDLLFVDLPLTTNGNLGNLVVDTKKIWKVRFFPKGERTLVHETVENDAITEEIPERWQGKLQDGTIVPVREEDVLQQFGPPFVNEIKTLGNQKYVPVPVGATRLSVLEVLPQLKDPCAPVVKYQQGGQATCVFSSFASALHSSGLLQLQHLANRLHQKSRKNYGGIAPLQSVRAMVESDVRWLQPKRTRKTFDWRTGIGPYDFFVGVIRDTCGSVQHAVSIHDGWIFDSNEPFALRLNQESLDYCTWEVCDGAVKQKSKFVSFHEGLLFIWQRKSNK